MFKLRLFFDNEAGAQGVARVAMPCACRRCFVFFSDARFLYRFPIMSSSQPRTRFIVVRHGETYWNLERRHQGHTDSPLTQNGLRQAEAMARRLAGVRVDALLCSDLGRARQTAEAILAQQPASLPVRYMESLRERNVGIFSGLTPAEATQQYPQQYATYCSGDPDVRAPQGESLDDLHRRIAAAMNGIAAEFTAGQTVVIVTHGGSLEQFLRYVMGIPMQARRACKFVNAAYNEFSHSGAVAEGGAAAESGAVTEGAAPEAGGLPFVRNDWLLHVWGETSHLGALHAGDDI